MLWISLCFFVQAVGNNLIAGGLGATYIYFTYGYAGGLYSAFTLVGMSATALLMIFYPKIAKNFGRKPLMRCLLFLSLAGYLMMLGSFLIPAMTGFWILTIGYMFAGFGQYGCYLIMMISILNTVEYNEYQFGRRDEAIIASVRPFVSKLGSAFIVLITSVTYMIFGVTKYTNEISALENEVTLRMISEGQKLSAVDSLLPSVTKGQTVSLLLVMVIISFAFMVISYALYLKHYRLDEAEYERICKELAKQ